MKTFEKNYIAKGKQVKDLAIIRISVKVEDILQFAHEYKGEQFITFEVAKLQNPDRFGNQYTVYVNKLVESEQNPPLASNPPSTPKTETSGKKSKKSKKEDDTGFPF